MLKKNKKVGSEKESIYTRDKLKDLSLDYKRRNKVNLDSVIKNNMTKINTVKSKSRNEFIKNKVIGNLNSSFIKVGKLIKLLNRNIKVNFEKNVGKSDKKEKSIFDDIINERIKREGLSKKNIKKNIVSMDNKVGTENINDELKDKVNNKVNGKVNDKVNDNLKDNLSDGNVKDKDIVRNKQNSQSKKVNKLNSIIDLDNYLISRSSKRKFYFAEKFVNNYIKNKKD